MSEQLFSLLLVLAGAVSGIIGSFVTMRYQHSREREFKRKDYLLDAYKEWVAEYDRAFQNGYDFCEYFGNNEEKSNVYEKLYDDDFANVKSSEVKLLLLESDSNNRTKIESISKNIEIFTALYDELKILDCNLEEETKRISFEALKNHNELKKFIMQLADSNHFV